MHISTEIPAKIVSTSATIPVMIGILSSALTGCGNEGSRNAQRKQVQQTPRNAVVTPTKDPKASDLDAAKTAYREFIQALVRADSLPDETRKKQLAHYMVDPQLFHVLKVIKRHQAKHLRTYGAPVIHLAGARVDGRTATVYDCQDGRNAGLRNTRTGKKINRGLKEAYRKTTLKKGRDGRWRASKTIHMYVGCW